MNALTEFVKGSYESVEGWRRSPEEFLVPRFQND
jgi:hypothetical protein